MKNENIWIKCYKVLIYVSAFCLLFFGLVKSLDKENFELAIITIMVASMYFILGMVLTTFFENVESIRQNLEHIDTILIQSEDNTDYFPTICSHCKHTIYVPDGTRHITCPLCDRETYCDRNTYIE